MTKSVLYASKVWECDGIGSFEYHIAKHFKDNKNVEIEIWYKDCHPDQLSEFSKVAKCVQYVGQQIVCDNFIFSNHDLWDNQLLSNVNAKNIVCCFHEIYPTRYAHNNKVTKYVAVSREAARIQQSVLNKPVDVFYPIVDIEKPTRTTPTNDGVLRLLSSGRFNDNGKCPDLMNRLAERLKQRNIKYEWTIIGINNEHVFSKGNFKFKGRTCNRDEIFQEIVNNDFLVQFTKAEGFGLSIEEALSLDVPIITSPFSVLYEHNVNDSNCIVMNYDCSNIDTVIDKILDTELFKFKYEPLVSKLESLINPKKLSIIIPVYNQENLIKRCLDSIPERDDIEVLIVNDGSTDNTLNILKEYDRIPITVYHLTKNMGVGYARNIGLKYALGEYIYGIDSDDYIDTEIFNKVLDTLPVNYDIIHNWVKIKNGNMWGDQNWCCAPHTMFIKRSFINDTIYPSIRYAEDQEFLIRLKAKQPKETSLDKSLCFYNYNYPREGSLDWIRTHENTSA